MSFNLKKYKQAQLTTYDVNSVRNLIMENIGAIQNLSPQDSPDAMLQFNQQLSDLGVTLQDAQTVVPELQEVLEKQQMMQQTIPPTQNMEEGQPMVITPIKGQSKKIVKSFNLKRSQEAMPPMDPMSLNDTPELMGDQLEMTDEGNTNRKFSDGADVREWLQNGTNIAEAINFISGVDDGTGRVDTVKEMIEDFYDSMDEPMMTDRQLERKAGQIYDLMPEQLKEDNAIPATFKQFSKINDEIKKLAEKYISHRKKSSARLFNLKKFAQHKTLDNTLLWGPGQTRIDPFYGQPVSDWHIIERNKGFGLVVGDVWNIDYETIWRNNIMDKYYRPYRDKEGNWVGGYIQKRFEVDKNIPESSNYQLKPGQIRRPVLPEYGNTESRLQAARAAGNIEGSIDKSKPFNWKEAQKKKS